MLNDLQFRVVHASQKNKKIISIFAMFQLLTMAMLASANQDGFVGVHHPPKPAGLWNDIFHPCKSALNP